MPYYLEKKRNDLMCASYSNASINAYSHTLNSEWMDGRDLESSSALVHISFTVVSRAICWSRVRHYIHNATA